MGQSPKKLSTLRRARVESFEARMMMSAQSPAAQLAQQAKPVTDGLVQPQTTASSAYSFTGLASERATYGLTGAGQTVAVIDTGIAYDHSALGGG